MYKIYFILKKMGQLMTHNDDITLWTTLYDKAMTSMLGVLGTIKEPISKKHLCVMLIDAVKETIINDKSFAEAMGKAMVQLDQRTHKKKQRSISSSMIECYIVMSMVSLQHKMVAHSIDDSEKLDTAFLQREIDTMVLNLKKNVE
jgi:hypothetical protein